ncbi:phage holin family protein [Jonesia quinghaiensis]|uniref:phage holin family protein n=1 Tax=Jonesia quinghaiensis TaxID=262806 RepID=UPI000490A6A9|nr:phage holin family protein [Jonesia quinghaiensis]
MDFIKRLIVTAVAFWLTTLLLGANFQVIGEFSIVDGNEFINRSAVFLVVALIFALINAIVKPIAQFLSFPLIILTLGLFLLVINAVMILLAAWITQSNSWGIEVNGFWWAMLAAVIIAVVSSVGNGLLRAND